MFGYLKNEMRSVDGEHEGTDSYMEWNREDVIENLNTGDSNNFSGVDYEGGDFDNLLIEGRSGGSSELSAEKLKSESNNQQSHLTTHFDAFTRPFTTSTEETTLFSRRVHKRTTDDPSTENTGSFSGNVVYWVTHAHFRSFLV